MSGLTDFKIFMDKRLHIRRPPEEKDRNLALHQFRSVSHKPAIGEYVKNLEKARSDLVSDMISGADFDP